MTHTFRLAAAAAALLAGTAAASAQTVITTETQVIPAPPVAIAPAPAYIAPGPAYVVPAPAADVVVAPTPYAPRATFEAERIVTTAPPVASGPIVEPAPRPIIRHRARTTEVRLTQRERRAVLHTVRAEAPVRTVAERVSYRVGAPLPASVPVSAIPQRVVYAAPALSGYDYAMVGGRMLVVEPGTNMVVEEIR